MLDVYPPEHTPHTWRDFFIHIATIVVGLIIAISLDQTVEAIHHARERRELIRELRAESRQNIGLLHTNIDRQLSSVVWESTLLTILQQAKPQHNVVTVVLPPHTSPPPSAFASRAVWSVAKTNGTAALLPEKLAEVFDRLNHEISAYDDENNQLATTSLAVAAQEERLHILPSPGSTIRLPAADVPALTQALAADIAAQKELLGRGAYWAGAAQAVANGVEDREAFIPYMKQEIEALHKRMPPP